MNDGKKYWVVGGTVFVMILSLVCGYLFQCPALSVAALLWLAVTVSLLKRERNLCRRQMEELSGMFNDILERTPLVFSGTMRDTLDGKLAGQMDKLQGLLQYYDRALWEEQESIKRLITEIAHQLRTPLANLEVYLSLCKADASGEELTLYLDAIEVSEGKIAFLIESFIKISRLEHYCIQIKKEKRDIRETLFKAMAALEKKAAARQVGLKLLTAEPLQVLHDKNWLCEAVQNLLDNSIKYSSAGGAVEISFQDNEMFTRIQVRDYGIGIEAGEEAQVFKRFYRGKRAAGEEGFGVGLYLAREIVLQHGGFMKVTRKEQGLLAEIYLPR